MNFNTAKGFEVINYYQFYYELWKASTASVDSLKDLEASVDEQSEEFENFGKDRRHSIILRKNIKIYQE